jgi:hypothetical protein
MDPVRNAEFKVSCIRDFIVIQNKVQQYLHVGVLAFLKTHVAAVFFGRTDLKKQIKNLEGYYKCCKWNVKIITHCKQLALQQEALHRKT